ncbi:MAG TPA: M48 family metallopeptidase [Armatimonadota bacterium]|nr:M48 family metallopeptidase [Armatimonadota bacterium]
MKRFLSGLVLGAALALALAGATAPRKAAAQHPRADPAPAAPEPGPERLEPRDLQVRVTPQMTRYSNTVHALYFAGTVFNALVLLLFLRSGLSARLRDLAERKGKNGLARAYIYYPLYSLLSALLHLPLRLYAGYFLPHQYGLSTQTLGGWTLDSAKSLGISAALAPPVIALLYWTLQRSPRRWWVGFWLASIPLLVFSILLAPILIDPLFNKFQPLRDERLRDRILTLARRAGIEESRVLEQDASRRTKAVNAYVTGLGGSARIVLWDTLLQRMDEEETLFVMAHEMGHYVEGHVPLLLAASIGGTLAILLLVHAGGHALLRVNGERWGVRGLDDLAGLPAILLLVLLLNFFGSPVESAVSRTLEERADAFGLRLTGNGRAAASAFIKLSEQNLSHPSPPPFIEFWMFSHPPLQRRIEKAQAWDAAHEGRSR